MTSFEAVVAELESDPRWARHVRRIERGRRVRAMLLVGLSGLAGLGSGYGIVVAASDRLPTGRRAARR